MHSGRRRIALAVIIVAGLALVLAMPRRRTLITEWARGKVEVARGCTVLTPGIFDREDRFEQARVKVRELQRDEAIAMFDTPIGSIWYPIAWWTLPALVEMDESDEYALRSSIKAGDIVIDAGAGVGVAAATALAAGAALVVAVEPDPLSLECLARNLRAEIREKRVVVVPKGVLDREQTLPLYLDARNGGAASFVWKVGDQSIQVPVTTIDRICAELNLPTVNLIKVHVEGAERKALEGASATIGRAHPRLAISLEHHLEDAEALPEIARKIWPGYHVQLTACTKTFNRIHPAVALISP